MKLWSDSFTDGGVIPDRFGFCVPAAPGPATFGPNLSPHLAWADAPEQTRSFVVTCVDPTAPAVGDDVNKPGRSVPASLPRAEFAHWLLINIPVTTTALAEGACASGVKPRGKGPSPPGGVRHGLNDYTSWFADDPDMRGLYFGYDGPCPPWNDELVHRYVFTVFATDLDSVPVEHDYRLADLRAALESHVFEQASISGLYTLNKALRGAK